MKDQIVEIGAGWVGTEGQYLKLDSNNDGIPDAFENRRSITEILNEDSLTTPTQSTAPIVPTKEIPASTRFVVDKRRNKFTVLQDDRDALVILVEPK